ncbi:MAG: fatty acid desaturase, partial [Pseudomonadota bacterium]
MTTPVSTRRLPLERPHAVEWVTLGLYLACVAGWGLAVFALASWSVALAIPVLTLVLVLHSSLSHEVLHGHPFPSRRASEALVVVTPGLFVPYLRFRDTHLAHHQDSRLTDPYDDPESNYLDPAVWNGLSWPVRHLLALNNTLAGRILIGPLVSQVAFMRSDWRAIAQGDRQVLRGWALHVPGVAIVLILVWLSPLAPGWYVLACYLALSILKIRTFLEHQAHEAARGRTAIVEDRGILAFLFLNN